MARMNPSGKATFSARVDEQLLEEFSRAVERSDDWENNSEAVRELMRDVVDRSGRVAATDGGRMPPVEDELARGYNRLRNEAGGRLIPLEEARAALAEELKISQRAVSRRVLRPLHKRGYLRQTGNIRETWLEVLE